MSVENPELRGSYEVLSGERVAGFVERVFSALSPELREHLVDSNVVLTLAGLKPQTEFFVTLENEECRKKIEDEVEGLNASLEAHFPEVKFHLAGEPRVKPRTQEVYQMISVENLHGYERATVSTKIPDIPPYDSKTGWEGLSKWRKTFFESFDKLPDDEKKERENQIIGIMKGYPDVAINDFMDWLRSGEKHLKGMDFAKIPFMGLYQEAEPAYEFKKEHADDPSIVANIKEAGDILRDFYRSEFHQRVAPSLEHHRSEWVFDEAGERSRKRGEKEMGE